MSWRLPADMDNHRKSTCTGSFRRPAPIGIPAVVNDAQSGCDSFAAHEEKVCASQFIPPFFMDESNWFAIKTRRDFYAEESLRPVCDEVFFPTHIVREPSGVKRVKAIIPRVLFIKTSARNALALETAGRTDPAAPVRFWTYRYPDSKDIQIISSSQINILKLLTAEDSTRCEIFNKRDFHEGQRVRITGGEFEGYEGYVQRVKKNKHVIVKIEGICLVMLPFIHPDLLEPID